MTLDGFLGFLALFVAIFAIIPPVARLRLQLHLISQVLLAFTAFALVLYLEFFSLLEQPCLLSDEFVCEHLRFLENGSFTPQQAAFLVVLSWMAIAILLNSRLRVGPGALGSIGKIVNTLLQERRHAELIDFIEPHLNLIARAATRQLPLQRGYDWIADVHFLQRHRFNAIRPQGGPQEAEPPLSIWARLWQALRQRTRWVRVFIPAQVAFQRRGDAIARTLLRSEELRRFLVTMRPDAIPSLLDLKVQARFDWADQVLDDFISDRSSRLYAEIEQNQNLANDFGYVIPLENRLLSSMFQNIEVARELHVWKPVGDRAIELIRGGARSGYVSELNEPFWGQEDVLWRDPVFVTLRFFDIMVHEGMRQNVEDHMWLFYVHLIVEELVNIYDDSAPRVDRGSEFPTLAARLIYEAIDVMGNWVRAVRNLDDTSRHAAIPTGGDLPLWVIPVGAGVALANSLVAVSGSARIGDRFAGYLHDCIMYDISVLQRTGKQGDMRKALIRTLVSGGNRTPALDYLERLAHLLKTSDHVLRSKVTDYVEALTAAQKEISS